MGTYGGGGGGGGREWYGMVEGSSGPLVALFSLCPHHM